MDVIEMKVFCDKAPYGWKCTRHFGHSGPCAAERLEHSLQCSYMLDAKCQICDCGFWGMEDADSNLLKSNFAAGNEKTKDHIIAALREEVDKATTAQVYGFYHDETPIFVQGNEAGEVCDLVTAQQLNTWIGRDSKNVVLQPEECNILIKLVGNHVVGPAAQKVVDKLKEATS